MWVLCANAVLMCLAKVGSSSSKCQFLGVLADRETAAVLLSFLLAILQTDNTSVFPVGNHMVLLKTAFFKIALTWVQLSVSCMIFGLHAGLQMSFHGGQVMHGKHCLHDIVFLCNLGSFFFGSIKCWQIAVS
jgi:hypothetical protein